MIAAIEAIVGQSPVQKRGRKGVTHFFRAGPAVVSCVFRRGRDTVLDLLAAGRQTVIPPTRHPDTERPYVWTTEHTLEHVSPDQLPLLPDDIAARLAEALKPFDVAFKQERVRGERVVSDGDNEWRETNDAALANLGAWVEDLGIGARREGTSWRGNARKGGDSFALSFHPEGITDFVTKETFSPIDIVAKIAGVEPCEAMQMLRKKLDIKDAPRIRLIFRRPWPHVWPWPWSAPVVIERVRAEDPVMAAAAEIARAEAGDDAWAAHSEAAFRCAGHHLQHARDSGLDSSNELVAAWMMQEVRAEQRGGAKRTKPVLVAVAEPEAEAAGPQSTGKHGKADPLDAITLGRDVDWTSPVGLMGQMSKWMDTTAQCANAPLSVTGAESIIAAIAGHANLYGPTRLQSSIYAIMAGVTTIGKESVLASVKKILTAAIPLRIWTSDAYSLAAIDGLIVDRPALLMVVDEITKTLFARILSSRANEHAEGLLGFLIQAFTLTMGTDYVSTNRSPKSIIQSVTVPALQVSLLGGCRPDDLFKVLQAGNVSDGFLNRLTVVEAGPRVINDDPLVGGVPSSFIDDLRSIVIADRRADGNVLALIRHPVSRMIPWASNDVRRAWTDFRNLTFGIIDSAPPPEGAIYGRLAEKTLRGAQRHALSRAGGDAEIELGDLHWGAARELSSVRVVRNGVLNMMADTPFEKKRVKLRALLANWRLGYAHRCHPPHAHAGDGA